MLIRRCLIAIGLVSAMAVTTPALAQSVSIHPGGVGIHFGHDHHDRDWRADRHERNWRADRHDRNWRADRHDRNRERAERGFAFERGRFGGCRTVTTEHDDGSVHRVRRCD